MSVPLAQMWTVATYVLRQKIRRRKRYPLVLMLEPLFRCNLACAGCGKIQYPAHILKKQLTPEECFRAVDDCGAPMVSIPGGEPLMHPQISEIVAGLVARKKYVYLCTNALLLKEKLHQFTPSKYLTFSVHMDGQREHHDFSVCREGGYDIAIEGIKAAVARGFRVTTNTTLFDGADPQSVRAFFDDMMELGVEGMMVSPGYSYEKAPDQQHFLGKSKTRKLFSTILSNRKKSWKFNQSPLFLEYLMGLRHYTCTPWGMPTYNIFGWQKPCYLLQDGYADSFAELMESTKWQNYGTESGNPKCANCMVHSGYEASAVNHAFSLKGVFAAARATLFGGAYGNQRALEALEEKSAPIEQVPIIQLTVHSKPAENDLFERAFDYRGDVTITLKNGSTLEGYVFDRLNIDDGLVRIIPKGGHEKLALAYREIERLEFTGRDTAAGNTFQNWMKKYWEKKRAGETNIRIDPEQLD